MTDPITQQQINQTAWAACDTFRGAVDAGQYKDYILVMGTTKNKKSPQQTRRVWTEQSCRSSITSLCKRV